jgi:hypothetical protein
MKLIFLAISFAACSLNPFHKEREYDRRQAGEILGLKLPTPGESSASIVHVPNFYLENEKDVKIWIPMKLFWQRYLKRNVGIESDSIIGIPKGRNVKLYAHKDSKPWKYKFVSHPLHLTEYVKRQQDLNYVKVKGPKSYKSIILFGYVCGKNIVMTEEISFHEGKDKQPAMLPAILKTVHDGILVNLDISKEYKFHFSDGRQSEIGYDPIDLEMLLPEYVIDSESSLLFKQDFIDAERSLGLGKYLMSNLEQFMDIEDAQIIKFMSV